jgi:predicted enzyme related to lactoylglutathione lyase
VLFRSAAEFYHRLLGWEFDSMPGEENAYKVIRVGREAIGGVVKAPAGTAAVWGCYVTVDDVRTLARQCEALGGRVLMPATEIPTVGRMAVLQDPQGAVFHAISYDETLSAR